MNLPEIDKTATGENLKRLMRKNKVSVFDIQYALKVNSPSSIYAWTQGRILPSTDNLVKLSAILHCTMDDIIIKEGETDV